MFKLFRKKITKSDVVISNKITKRDVVISNISFHMIWNSCRELYPPHITDPYPDELWYKIMNELLRLTKDGASSDKLYRTISEELQFHGISSWVNFENEAQRTTDVFNRTKEQEFKNISKSIIENKFSVNNIEKSISMSK